MVTLGLPSSAQTSSAENRRMNSSTAQAQLHINVIVVPVVIPPRHHRDRDRDRDRNGESVSYNLAAREERLSVTEEVRPMLVDVLGKGLQQQPVQLTTVVAR
jgi:hypothetical protein